MSRKPSPETELRNLRRSQNRLDKLAVHLSSERDRYRIRATKAEQEAAEWKQRFDALLARVPKLEGAP